MRIYFGLSLLLCMTFSALSQSPKAPSLKNWKRHVIDDTSRGADGTRLADINGDGLPDIATGWEQGGVPGSAYTLVMTMQECSGLP